MKRKHLIVAAVALAAVAVLAVTVAPESYAAFVDPQALLAALVIAGAGGFVGDIELLRSKELRQKRAELVETNRKLLDKIAAETDQARVKELETEWDKRDADIIKLSADVTRAERQEALDAELRLPANERRSGREPGPTQQGTDEERKARYRAAFFNYLRMGPQFMSPEDQQILRTGWQSVTPQEARAMSLTVAAGGYTVPEGFIAQLQQNMLAFGGVRPMANVFTTGSGNSLPMPTTDDTSNEAAIVGEGSALTSPQDPTFGVITFGAFMYRTLCLASIELLQDTAFDLDSFIRGIVAERVARGTNRHFTVGNGSTQPHGFIPASSSGVTGSSATSISTDDLVDLEHSVDPAYRTGPKVGWQMADGTLKILKKLKDSQNRPLWLPGFAVREPDTILGYKYGINQHMAAVAASNKSLAFGDWSKYWIRDIGQLLIVRANELHIGNGQIGFYVFSRHDAKMVDAGTDPVKHLTHPSPN
jgi:HK97 family phage major capsid protein